MILYLAPLYQTYEQYCQYIKPENTSGSISLESNKIYRITPTGNITFHLPEVTDDNVNKFNQILVMLNITNSHSFIFGTTYYFDLVKPTFTTGLYDLIYEYDNNSNQWVCGAIKKGTVA